MTASGLYVGRVTHHRLRGPAHRLSQRIYMLLIDLEEADELIGRLRLLPRGRFGLLSFHEADHGDRSGAPLLAQVRDKLAAAGLDADGPVRLLCMPRVLGFGFNPLSVYFCHRRDGELTAVLYEVSNTFGERHSYLIEATSSRGGVVRQSAAKRFHVSPFMDMDLDYDFVVRAPDEGVHVSVGVRDADGPLMATAFLGRRRELTDASLLRAFVACPMLTVSVIAGIHWHALKLVLRGARYRRKPPAPPQPLTVHTTLQAVHDVPERRRKHA